MRVKPIKILVSWCPTAKWAERPQTRSLVEIENKSQKKKKSAAEAARNADARHETKLIKGIANLSRLGQKRSYLEIRGPSKPEDGEVDKEDKPTATGRENSTTLRTQGQGPCMKQRYYMSMLGELD